MDAGHPREVKTLSEKSNLIAHTYLGKIIRLISREDIIAGYSVGNTLEVDCIVSDTGSYEYSFTIELWSTLENQEGDSRILLSSADFNSHIVDSKVKHNWLKVKELLEACEEWNLSVSWRTYGQCLDSIIYLLNGIKSTGLECRQCSGEYEVGSHC